MMAYAASGSNVTMKLAGQMTRLAWPCVCARAILRIRELIFFYFCFSPCTQADSRHSVSLLPWQYAAVTQGTYS